MATVVDAADPELADGGVDAFILATAGVARRRRLRLGALSRQPHPFRDMLRPLQRRQVGAMQVLGDFPETGVGAEARRLPPRRSLSWKVPTNPGSEGI